LKKIKLAKAGTVVCKPFVLADFTQDKEMQSRLNKTAGKVSKKVLKSLADDLGLDYDEKQISFTKKLMMVYLERQERLGK